MKRGFDGKTSSGHSPSGILPHYKMVMCSLLTWPFGSARLQMPGVCSLLTAVMVLSAASCNKAPGLQSGITVHINCDISYSTIDIFVYSDTLTRQLESRLRYGGETFLHIPANDGDKILAAFANVPGAFIEGALANYAEAEQLTMRYCLDNPDSPLLSGSAQVYASPGARCELKLLPLLCPITIGKISIEGDAPLEDPVLRLENVNEQARVLQTDGFHPVSTVSSAESLLYPLMMVRPLTFDLGNTPRESGVTLWCYPDETVPGPGGEGTVLVVSGELNGTHKEYRKPLGKIRRGSRLHLDLALE